MFLVTWNCSSLGVCIVKIVIPCNHSNRFTSFKFRRLQPSGNVLLLNLHIRRNTSSASSNRPFTISQRGDSDMKLTTQWHDLSLTLWILALSYKASQTLSESPLCRCVKINSFKFSASHHRPSARFEQWSSENQSNRWLFRLLEIELLTIKPLAAAAPAVEIYERTSLVPCFEASHRSIHNNVYSHNLITFIQILLPASFTSFAAWSQAASI